MNREQKRAKEKQSKKDKFMDITVEGPVVPDGAQFRIPATGEVDGKKITFSLATVCMPFIYAEKDSPEPGFVIKFAPGVEKKIIGIDYKECLLMDIYTGPQFRKLGIGTLLVEAMKNFFIGMVTGVRSPEGKSLMERCGFKLNEQAQLVWTKEMEDASKGNENEVGEAQGDNSEGNESQGDNKEEGQGPAEIA